MKSELMMKQKKTFRSIFSHKYVYFIYKIFQNSYNNINSTSINVLYNFWSSQFQNRRMHSTIFCCGGPVDRPGNRATSSMSPGLMSPHSKTVPVPRENTYYLLRKRLLPLDWERNRSLCSKFWYNRMRWKERSSKTDVECLESLN